jgi:hypothetical protein
MYPIGEEGSDILPTLLQCPEGTLTPVSAYPMLETNQILIIGFKQRYGPISAHLDCKNNKKYL